MVMTTNIQATLGHRIRSLRKSCSLTQEELGELSKLHNTYVGAIERGERNPSLKTLEKIAYALNVKIGDLFSFIDYKEDSVREELKHEFFSLLEAQDKRTIKFMLSNLKNMLATLKEYFA